jgi:hypothetical protein
LGSLASNKTLQVTLSNACVQNQEEKMIVVRFKRTSDSLLKMDIRAAHEWSRLKAACL